ncbi:hypothetical protein GGS23DRAFT_620545 [Durotheca rogersii]|uniref:uncharacterized protein n=1 Tax=Durotheca rogersii TaxID=419775 RepID=UPI00221F55D8|nr:uncharacterized protein GGS23DRAFT_620545 [Durotheca rogersii]KAI5863723.1 hypothetical protein GGS23DRAFT_620545 [Durotheca rogersii]
MASASASSGGNPFSALFNPDNVVARLAALQPAETRDAPIELSTMDALLGSTAYECISYDRSVPLDADADLAPETTISVDGEPVAVPAALAAALRAFRRRDRTRTLWADLLVGGTAEERSAAAVTTRHVLTGAERTLCWLTPEPSRKKEGVAGEAQAKEEEDLTARAVEIIREMALRFQTASARVGLSENVGLSHATLGQLQGIRDDLHACPYDDLDSFNFGLWNRIYAIFGAGYWRCVQPVSEIVLARAPVIVVAGSSSASPPETGGGGGEVGGGIRWRDYIAASRALPFFQARLFGGVPLLPSVMHGFETANTIEIAERRRRLGESVELLPMIGTARDCTGGLGPITNGAKGKGMRAKVDPRESVFSMLHIATPSARVNFHAGGPQPLPAIDYSKTVEEVFTDAARYCALERQDLMLWFGERPPCAKRLRGLPSWVPDFSAVYPKTGVMASQQTGMRAWWDAIPRDDPAAAKLIAVSTRAGRPALHLQARPLDRVAYVSPLIHGGNCRRLAVAELRAVSALPPSAFAAYPGEAPAQRTERFWRTLILDVGRDPQSAAAAAAAPGGPATAFHDSLTARADASLAAYFDSLVAEESLTDGLGCESAAELREPAVQARIAASPAFSELARRAGRGAPFADLVARHAAGRRLFRTEGGRFGMTAVEDPAAADPNLREAPAAEEEGEEEEGEQQQQQAEGAAPARPPNFGPALADPLGRAMLASFQDYLAQRDPRLARITARALAGELPGQDAAGADQGGARPGDLVVACVGGFAPYMMRPLAAAAAAPADDDTYEFVGECYLHGAMDGEDFKERGFFGGGRFRVDTSRLVDITVV